MGIRAAAAGLLVGLVFTGPLCIGVAEEVKAPNESSPTPAGATGTKIPDLEKMYVGSWTSPAAFRDNASFTLAWSEAEGRLQLTAYTWTDRSGKQDLTSRVSLERTGTGYTIKGTTVRDEPFSISDLKPEGKEHLKGWVRYLQYSNPVTYGRP